MALRGHATSPPTLPTGGHRVDPGPARSFAKSRGFARGLRGMQRLGAGPESRLEGTLAARSASRPAGDLTLSRLIWTNGAACWFLPTAGSVALTVCSDYRGGQAGPAVCSGVTQNPDLWS